MTAPCRWGAGLGGSTTISLVLGFDIASPQDADGAERGPDFALDLGMAGK